MIFCPCGNGHAEGGTNLMSRISLSGGTFFGVSEGVPKRWGIGADEPPPLGARWGS